MWFKNLNIFSLSNEISYDPSALAEELSAYPFSPCTKVTPHTAGFIPPIGGEHAPLVHAADGYLLFCLKIQKKMLPASVVNEQLADQIEQLESKEGRSVYRDEKQRMKEELYYTLLSQAFVTSTRIYGYFDTKRQELLLSTNAANDCEKLFLFLNKVFPKQTILPYALYSPAAIMTKWLATQHYPSCLSLADNCVVCESDEQKGVVRFSKKDLATEALQKLLAEGSHIIQLGVNWREQIQCQLRQDLTISGIKFHDSVRESAKDILTETEEDRLATDFYLMAETFSNFLADLLPAFLDESANKSKSEQNESVVETA